jgi:hypothetical protein
MPTNLDVVYVKMVSNYMCRLTDTVSSNMETIAVEVPVIPDVTITASPGALISIGQSDTLRAIVNNAVSPTYQWFINGVPVPGATNATFISNNFGVNKEDSVSCQVINTVYCQEKGFSWIYISVHPVGVTQVGGGSADIRVIPNPNKGVFTIKGSMGSTMDREVTVELTDVLGQVVYKDKLMAKNGKIDKQVDLGNSLANGMYMLSVRSESEHKVFHIVIEQ